MTSSAVTQPLETDYRLVPMTEEHRQAVMDIFNYYVENSFAAYPDTKLEYRFFDHLLNMCRGYSALVVTTSTGEVAGFALLHPYHPAPTFKRTAELSYFLAPAHTRKGIGKLVLERLVADARLLGIGHLLASVSSRNEESLAFHRNNGFSECGRFHQVGHKFERDFDVVWFERKI
ncbi:MAG TPA: GNAT family N-acetyltransferase [Terriglobales bacterium]|nr:GNAT family N-acetyltransferase [Terriglobales bacterium]